MRVGIVDLGTNSVRFAIYDCFPSGATRQVYRVKKMLRPGKGVYETGRLHPQIMAKIVRAFEKFSRRCTKDSVEQVTAIATSALREARNRRELIERIERRSGIRVQVISGVREAHLIAKGILAHDSVPAPGTVLIDIGGGSTEVTLVQGGVPKFSRSLRLGSARLQQLFPIAKSLRGKNVRAETVAVARRHIRKELQSLRAKVPSMPTRFAIGSSGTIRALARLISAQTKSTPFKVRGPLRFTRQELAALVDSLVPLSKSQLLKLPGLEPRRAEQILMGSVLLLEILDCFSVHTIRTSAFNLRDGILAEVQERIKRKRRNV